MFEQVKYEHEHSRERGEGFNHVRHQEIVDTIHGCARGHKVKERYTGRYAWPDFDNASHYYKEQITSSLETAEPTDGSSWAAQELVDALHELKDYSLSEMSTAGYLSKASNYLCRIEQAVMNNIDAFKQLAEHPDEALSSQAASLIGHAYISFGYFDSVTDPDMLDYVLPALKHEQSLINKDNQSRRHTIFFRNMLLGDDEALREGLFNKLSEPDADQDLLKDIQVNLVTFSYRSKREVATPTVDQLRSMIPIGRLGHRNGAPSGVEAEQALDNIIASLPAADSDVKRLATRQIIETAQELKVGNHYIDSLLTTLYNLNSNVLNTAWVDAIGSKYQGEFWDYRKRNIDAIAELEMLHPGSARYLFDRYRIKNFARPPVSVLATQYEESVAVDQDPRALSSRPLTNRVYLAEYDHSGVFAGRGALGFIAALACYAERAKQRLEIFEVGHVGEIINDIQNSPQLIGSIALCAHGSGPSSTLSRSRSLNRAHMLTSWHQTCRTQLSSKFAPGATGIFNSCHTGKDDQLGEVSSDFFGMRVFAPDYATSLYKITELSDAYDPHMPLQLQPIYSDTDALRVFGNQR